jgi:sugar phosphate isomerase/epimerase
MPTKENISEIVDTAKTLGYTCHISGGGPDDFKDKNACRVTGEKFKAASELLKPHGLTFGMHNHWWEFDKKIDGKTPYDIALEIAPDTICQIDTYWVKVGGMDPAAVIQQHAKQTQLLHIKDGPLDKDKAMTAIGRGKMDWKSVMQAAQDSAVKWLVVELDRCDTDMMDAIHESLHYLVDEGFGDIH